MILCKYSTLFLSYRETLVQYTMEQIAIQQQLLHFSLSQKAVSLGITDKIILQD